MTANIYQKNRNSLAKSLKNPKFILIGGNGLLSKSADVNFDFRQDSNMLYFTGLNQPSTSLFIDVGKSKHYLVVPKISKIQQFFEGKASSAELLKNTGCDAVIHYRDLAKIIKGQKIYFNLPPKTQNWGVYANPFRRWLKQYLTNYGVSFTDLRPNIASLRMIKQPYELKNIRTAVKLTKNTLTKLEPKLWQKTTTEQSFANDITMAFLKAGTGHGYSPIIAAGQNAATLHHFPTKQATLGQKMVLIDVGAEINHYSADISRTFTQHQDDIYEDIKTVQTTIISNIKPGVLIKDLHNMSVNLLAQIAKKHKITEPIKDLYPQAIGHHLGLDVHDAANYKLPLQPNMVITVEPGLCSKQLGFGYRVEDDVLVTKNGALVL
jgi:Xaa-Pro aminopeptidase